MPETPIHYRAAGTPPRAACGASTRRRNVREASLPQYVTCHRCLQCLAVMPGVPLNPITGEPDTIGAIAASIEGLLARPTGLDSWARERLTEHAGRLHRLSANFQ